MRTRALVLLLMAVSAHRSQAVPICDPQQIGELAFSGSPWDIAIQDGFAFVADESFGLIVFDMRDPGAPALAATLALMNPGAALAVDGDLACITRGWAAPAGADLSVIDISDPFNPLLRSVVLPIGDRWGGVALDGRIAFASYDVDGPGSTARTHMQVVDLSAPDAPALLGAVEFGVWSGLGTEVLVAGEAVYLAGLSGGLYSVGVHDLQNPVLLDSNFDVSYDTTGLVIEGDRLYLCGIGEDENLDAVDISDPSILVRVAYRNISVATDIAVSHGVGYVVYDWWTGVDMFDLTVPQFWQGSMPFVQSIPAPGAYSAIAIEGTRLVVVNGGGIRVYDIEGCEVCRADLTDDGVLDSGDLSVFIGFFLDGHLAADFAGDGVVDSGDLAEFIGLFIAGC